MEAKLKNGFVITTVVLTGILTGCSTGMSAEHYLTTTRENMMGQGKPPAYVQGYLDGCSTGRRMAGDKKYSYRRDNVRMDQDALYARGWQEGQIFCRNEAIAEKQEKLQSSGNGMGFFNFDEERQRRVEAESRRADAEVQEIWDELKK